MLASLLTHQSGQSLALEGCNRKYTQRLTSVDEINFSILVDLNTFTRLGQSLAYQTLRNVSTWVQLFGLTSKATWPETFRSSAKINCHTNLWVRGITVSVVHSASQIKYDCFHLILNHFYAWKKPSRGTFDIWFFKGRLQIRPHLNDVLCKLPRCWGKNIVS